MMTVGKQFTIRVDDWLPEYGQANRIGEVDRDQAPPTLMEDAERGAWVAHRGVAPERGLPSMAFVDGVRRTEGYLYASDGAGRVLHGLAGAFACGAVLVERDQSPRFQGCRAERVAIWGPAGEGDELPALPEVRGGWSWRSLGDSGHELSEPLRALEKRMRRAEGELADELAQKAHLTVVDGPLEFVVKHTQAVVGYIKTHHQQWLAPREHARIPELPVGYRTSLFLLRDDLLSAYVRVGAPSAVGSPWNGVARIELPRLDDLAQAVAVADQITGVLPRFAGVAHRDPRAPQNLQPVGALETMLRRLMGDAALTRRATRDAMARRPRA